MDKLGKVLIGVVCIVVFINTVILYGLYKESSQKTSPVDTGLSKEIEKEMRLANIAVNQTMQVINGSGEDMWVRAQIEIPEINGKKVYRLESENIYARPTSADIQRGVWVLKEDGYYYYSKTIPPGEQSVSIFKEIKQVIKTEGLLPEDEIVHVRAQAIQTDWVSGETRNAKEAFDLFGVYRPLEEYVGKIL